MLQNLKEIHLKKHLKTIRSGVNAALIAVGKKQILECLEMEIFNFNVKCEPLIPMLFPSNIHLPDHATGCNHHI